MVPFVLPTVLKIADDATKSDFENHILPHLRPVMKLKEPVQVYLRRHRLDLSTVLFEGIVIQGELKIWIYPHLTSQD